MLKEFRDHWGNAYDCVYKDAATRVENKVTEYYRLLTERTENNPKRLKVARDRHPEVEVAFQTLKQVNFARADPEGYGRGESDSPLGLSRKHQIWRAFLKMRASSSMIL